MRVWLMKDGENLPIQVGSRPMRTWMLADSLHARGHDVTWWTSTFSHQRKELLYKEDTVCEIEPRFKLRLLFAGEYQKNISLKRYFHHYRLGKRFSIAAEKEPPPDIILCSFPTINFAFHSVMYARQHKIPIVLDIRDFWPDLYLSRIPRYLRSIAGFLLARDFRKNHEVFSQADGIIGVSQGILNWALNYANRSQGCCDRVFHLGFPDKLLDNDLLLGSAQNRTIHSKEKTVFIFIGTFGTSYDLNTICMMARSLYDEGFNDAHFVLAGDGEQRPIIEELVRGLPNITLTGWLNRQELQNLVMTADVGLAPCISMADSMPNKIYEYFSAGLPVLASLKGEVEQLLATENVGFSYDVGDLKNLTSYVKKLTLDVSQRRAMSECARQLFERRFRAEDIYLEYAKFLEEKQAEFVARLNDL